MHEALHVLATNEGNVLAELLSMQLDQPMPVPIFLCPHFLEQFRGRGKVALQTVGEIVVDTGVLFFQRDRESQDLLLRETAEGAHGILNCLEFRRHECCES